LGKSKVYRPLGAQLQFFASREYSANLVAKLFKGGIQNIAAGVKNDGTLRGNIQQMPPDRFTHAPLQSVTHNSFAHRTRNSETKSGGQLIAGGAQAKRGKIAAGHANTGLIDLSKFCGSQNPV
jgi:hypothetical protein